MIPKEMKVPQNLRRVTETITVDGQFQIMAGTLGYLLGFTSESGEQIPRASFTSLCESYQFDVTHVPSDCFKSV